MLRFNIQIKLGWGNPTDYRLYNFRALLWKGGSAMNFTITVDWRFVVALGLTVSGIILSVKMESDAAERVSIHAIDACKDFAVADFCNQ